MKKLGKRYFTKKKKGYPDSKKAHEKMLHST